MLETQVGHCWRCVDSRTHKCESSARTRGYWAGTNAFQARSIPSFRSVPMAEEDGRRSKSFWAPLAVDYGEYVPLQAGSIDGTDTIAHDRGIVRAMNSRCKKLSSVSEFVHPLK